MNVGDDLDKAGRLRDAAEDAAAIRVKIGQHRADQAVAGGIVQAALRLSGNRQQMMVQAVKVEVFDVEEDLPAAPP